MSMFKTTSAKNPEEYINSISDESRREEIKKLHTFIQKTIPDLKPLVMLGMIGYGTYHYKYASGRQGDCSLVSLASQKNYISLYVLGVKDGRYLAETYKDLLGKVSVGKSCIRFKKMSDLNIDILKTVVQEGVKAGFGS